ncbi:MAG TPA: aconitate hydratase [Actinomycetes bacterium]|jgi:aconitate hydratase|nr:aconitate hydratase [Actinomycetes bacterium]
MQGTLTAKILEAHLVEGRLAPGEEIALGIDQTLLQDATGTMACMELEALGFDEVKVGTAMQYVDHNMLQFDHRNADDHLFLQTFAARYGIRFSRAGNGICHQVHTERVARPGATLLGADSHTPTSGSVGSIAIGAGGLEVALAMAGQPFRTPTPTVVGVRLDGELPAWVASKDLILWLIRKYTVKGGLNRIFEFTGPGVAALPVTQRATVCNMITELGGTTAIFPSDEQTRRFLRRQQREHDWVELGPDPDASYDEQVEVDLSTLEPLIAKPSQPDNVVAVEEVAGTEVFQVCFGSSVNSWYEDLAIPAAVLRGSHLPATTAGTVSPGSRQILTTITTSGVLEDLERAGARILEPACGPCVGIGQAPPSGKASVRTFNRNFKGRSGTVDDQVYLASPATTAATGLHGRITDPRTLGDPPEIDDPDPVVDDFMILDPAPPAERERIEIIRGPNIKTPPIPPPLPDDMTGRVLIVLPDNISTGSMAPDGAIVMADRSNVAAIAEYTFMKEDAEFVQRAKDWGGGFIVAGENYGQGSSREHAALAPLQLGIRGVLARGFARIHRRNLIAQGLVPLFIDAEAHERLEVGDQLSIGGLREAVAGGAQQVDVEVEGKGGFQARLDLSPREREVVVAGGVVNQLKQQAGSR